MTHTFARQSSVDDVYHGGNFLHLVRSDILMKITVFLYVVLSSLVEQYHCFKETYCPFKVRK